ncbi:MAG: efflux RND transporter periplasmic adaptor subunit [Verrucomicrobia bacterium]|nr:efflux RND transporter periplasmic adaptor subunit [Verrucomicrobiota bacterium]
MTLIIAVIAGLAVWLLLRPHVPNGIATVAAPTRIPTVAVVKVTREDLAQELTVDAEFRPYQDTDLFAKVAGFVKTIAVDAGDQVKEGQLLAVLEIPELKEEIEHAVAVQHHGEEEVKRAEAEITRTDASHVEAHLAYERLVGASKAQPGLIAEQEVEAAQARDRTTAAQLVNTRAGLSAAKQQVLVAQADVNRLRAKEGYATITAPFTGVITKRFADQGDFVRGGTSPSSQGMALVRVSQNQRLRLVFPVSVSFVARIKIGDQVDVRVKSVERSFQGKVSRFTREVDAATRTMETEVDVPNADLKLIPGMYATVTASLDRREKALTLPVEAVERDKRNTVYVVRRDGVIEERIVKIGLETPTKLEVLSGAKEGDMVMIGSRTQVKPGQRVEPKPMKLTDTE